MLLVAEATIVKTEEEKKKRRGKARENEPIISGSGRVKCQRKVCWPFKANGFCLVVNL